MLTKKVHKEMYVGQAAGLEMTLTDALKPNLFLQIAGLRLDFRPPDEKRDYWYATIVYHKADVLGCTLWRPTLSGCLRYAAKQIDYRSDSSAKVAAKVVRAVLRRYVRRMKA